VYVCDAVDVVLESKNLHVVINDLEDQLEKESRDLMENIAVRSVHLCNHTNLYGGTIQIF
jgi:hypothetical protein